MYDDVTTIRPPTMNTNMKMNAGERQSFGFRQAGVRISRLFWLGPHYFTPMQGHLESLGPADVRHSGFDWLFDRLYDWRASSPCGPPTDPLLTSRALKTTRRQTNSGTICCAPLLSALPRHSRGATVARLQSQLLTLSRMLVESSSSSDLKPSSGDLPYRVFQDRLVQL